MPLKPDTVAEIKKRIDSGQHQLIQDRLDFLLPTIRDFVKEKRWVNLHPEYQRRLVWAQDKKSRFIESLLMNIPIPPVFLFENELNRYEVMDGQQRLNAIVEFYENGFTLKGLESWKVLNGLGYPKFPDVLKRALDRRKLSSIVLSTETKSASGDQDVRRQVFERLNTGGQHLNAQEIRNCLYSRSFNELLIELSCLPQFTTAWDIPSHKYQRDFTKPPSSALAENQRYKRMGDCEIVLRFFAFRRHERIKGAVRSILDQCMEDHNEITNATVNDYRSLFSTRLSVAVAVFGKSPFQAPDPGSSEKQHSVALYDAVMVAVDRLWDRRTKLKANAQAIRRALDKSLLTPRTHALVVGRPNTAKAIKQRLKLVENLLKKHAK